MIGPALLGSIQLRCLLRYLRHSAANQCSARLPHVTLFLASYWLYGEIIVARLGEPVSWLVLPKNIWPTLSSLAVNHAPSFLAVIITLSAWYSLKPSAGRQNRQVQNVCAVTMGLIGYELWQLVLPGRTYDHLDMVATILGAISYLAGYAVMADQKIRCRLLAGC